jgi:hypothetical protein
MARWSTRDASHHGVEFTNLDIDGSALAVVAELVAAIEQRIRLTAG